jgi:hypothetical protein
MNNIQHLYQIKLFIRFPIFILKVKQNILFYVIYFTFFRVMNFDVTSNYLEAMA